MRKCLLAALALLSVLSCKHRKSLQEQITAIFSNHVKNLDSLVTLDSVHILWKIPLNERLGRIIDDSTYSREYMSIKTQLSSAEQKNDKDSIAFYQYEMAYMEKEIDSITASIPRSDTSRRFGLMVACAYFISKNHQARIDSTLTFLDSTSNLQFTDFMDSSIKRTIRKFN